MRRTVRILVPALAVGSLLLGASPAGAGDPIADGMIKLQGDAQYRGDDIYNLSGEGQTRTVAAHRGDVIRFRVRAENDAANSGIVDLEGTGGETGFRVRFYRGETNVTGDVVGGGGVSEQLDGGEGFALTLEVKVRASAPNGNFVVSMQAEQDPGSDDTMRARIKVS